MRFCIRFAIEFKSSIHGRAFGGLHEKNLAHWGAISPGPGPAREEESSRSGPDSCLPTHPQGSNIKKAASTGKAFPTLGQQGLTCN